MAGSQRQELPASEPGPRQWSVLDVLLPPPVPPASRSDARRMTSARWSGVSGSRTLPLVNQKVFAPRRVCSCRDTRLAAASHSAWRSRPLAGIPLARLA